jgi:hypothetical protein
MALIQCPDCEAEVSSLAPACPRCARPLAGTAPPVIRSQVFCCPHCESEEVQKLSVIYEMGSTLGNFRGGGVGIGTGGVGAGVFGGSNQGRTLAAGSAAPPAIPSARGALVMVALAVGFGLLCVAQFAGGSRLWAMLLLTAAFVIGAGLAIWSYVRDVRRYPARRRNWEQSWRCLRCGSGFVGPQS